MKKNQKALIRHNRIYHKLQAGETVNVKALAEEFKVGERTIQKDMNERLNALYDIEYLGEGNYRLRTPTFKGTKNEEESIAVSLMKSLQHSAVPQMDDYVDVAVPTSGSYDDIFIFGIHFEQIDDMEMFHTLIKAVKWKVGVEFTYTKLDGSRKRVLADPYRLANFQKYWYLIAYDPAAELLKTYYLNNISELTMLYENFTGNESIERELDMLCRNMDSVWWNDEKRSCLLKVTDKAKAYMQQRGFPENIELLETHDEHLLVRIYFYNDMELFSYVKSWMPWMHIVGDEVLAEKLREQVEQFFEI